MIKSRKKSIKSRISMVIKGPTPPVALLLGLAIISWSPSASAQRSSIDLARLKMETSEAREKLSSLKGPLSNMDIVRYRSAISKQQAGKWKSADHIIDKISNKSLVGHLMAQRYLHPTAYTSSYKELVQWLETYPDHPQSTRIFRLAKKKGGKMQSPPFPVEGYLRGSGQELAEEQAHTYQSERKRTPRQAKIVENWTNQVHHLVSKDRPTQATKLLKAKAAKLADPVEQDLAKGKIARGYYANRLDELAIKWGGQAALRSGQVRPGLHWVPGLAQWRSGNAKEALKHFAFLARHASSPRDKAGGAFWAARAAFELKDPKAYIDFLTISAHASDGFYGLLARELLGMPVNLSWHGRALDRSSLLLLEKFPGVKRALALSQVGEHKAAAAEIRKLAARSNPKLTASLAALAEAMALPAAQMRVAQRLRLQDGLKHFEALFPVIPWEPVNGFVIDRALLLSIARAESGFDPLAKSHAGALGLMQIRPSTAQAVAQENGYRLQQPQDLYRPETNLTLGQLYVGELLDNHLIEGNLIHLSIAYNAGLTRLDDWLERFGDLDDDPLLFIESIPVPETRSYVKKVMSNLWTYRSRLGQDKSSLKQLAANHWPDYSPLDRNSIIAASK